MHIFEHVELSALPTVFSEEQYLCRNNVSPTPNMFVFQHSLPCLCLCHGVFKPWRGGGFVFIVGMGRAGSCSSSSMGSSSQRGSKKKIRSDRDLSTDLQLGVGISCSSSEDWEMETHEEEGNNNSLYVKVYMEGHPIGRKLDVLAHNCYEELITTLDQMFNTNILWGAEVDEESYYGEEFHVLTYEDEEGDWMMLGDVPWEMFLSAVKRLKITRVCPSAS